MEDSSSQERQKLMAEVDERKRKILREVEVWCVLCGCSSSSPLMRLHSQVKAMELYDALESSGSYSKAEISERVDKYRDKLMQVPVRGSGGACPRVPVRGSVGQLPCFPPSHRKQWSPN